MGASHACLFVDCVSSGGSSGSTSLFRSFRLLRILKLAKSINSLRVLLATVMESLGNVFYMTVLLGLFVFIFAVLGVQVFAGQMEIDPFFDSYNFGAWAVVGCPPPPSTSNIWSCPFLRVLLCCFLLVDPDSLALVRHIRIAA